ncbi:MAG: putative DNA-binding domain-containing protein [Caulobacter sp.]|nr:putative DNA-binding domain-containing protein [Caulobacter sp.]
MQLALHQAVTCPASDSWARAGALLAASPLSAERRLSLYARGYRARLLDSLRREFPSLCGLMGAELFDLFAEGYIAACPPDAPSLHVLGARFPAWLESIQPAAGPGAAERIPAQLALLERAWSESLRAPGPEGVAPPPVDLLLHPAGRLRLPATTTLLTLEFDFAPLLAAVADGEAPPTPHARPTCVAIARSGYRVGLHTLSRGRHAWLAAVGHDGASALEAAGRAASEADTGDLLADLILWAPLAIQAGLIVAD